MVLYVPNGDSARRAARVTATASTSRCRTGLCLRRQCPTSCPDPRGPARRIPAAEQTPATLATPSATRCRRAPCALRGRGRPGWRPPAPARARGCLAPIAKARRRPRSRPASSQPSRGQAMPATATASHARSCRISARPRSSLSRTREDRQHGRERDRVGRGRSIRSPRDRRLRRSTCPRRAARSGARGAAG